MADTVRQMTATHQDHLAAEQLVEAMRVLEPLIRVTEVAQVAFATSSSVRPLVDTGRAPVGLVITTR
jgi:hypothetical protein